MNQLHQPKLWVLYADDDPEDIQYVGECLEDYAGAVKLLTFPDAEALLQCIRTQQIATLPCLVILDINMPRINGREALQMLRKIDGYDSVPVVLFSNSSAPHDAAFARRYDAELISKPLTQRQMHMIVERFLDRCMQTAR